MSTIELTELLKLRGKDTALQGDSHAMLRLNTRMLRAAQTNDDEHVIRVREFAIGVHEAVTERPRGHVASWIACEFKDYYLGFL